MANKQRLTPELVDSLLPPEKGEVWISDTELKGFGLRLWAGKKGGNKAYAIRVRSKEGRIHREVFNPEWHRLSWYFPLDGNKKENVSLGRKLGGARHWAREKLAVVRGKATLAERRNLRYARAQIAVRRLTIQEMAERVLVALEKRGRKDAYVIALRKQFATLPASIRNSLLETIKSSDLAKAIANPPRTHGNIRLLQSFVGQIYTRACRWHYPLRELHEKILDGIYRLSQRRRVQYPKANRTLMKKIGKFLKYLEDDIVNWRPALAIRLQFATGAKLNPILSSYWGQYIDNYFYPYLPSQRKYWLVGMRRLSVDAIRILELVSARGGTPSTQSEKFLFQSVSGSATGHITTVYRYWKRVSQQFGFSNLSLSHVVKRYWLTRTYSYQYFYQSCQLPEAFNFLNP
jgi:hypothetical protein